MPEDVGGTPSSDGREPDDDRDHGRADEEFAAVVFDEDFVRSAAVHEPSAVERLLAAAEARAEAEHRRRSGREPDPDGYDRLAFGDGHPGGFGGDPESDDPADPFARHGRGRRRGRRPHAGCVQHGETGYCPECDADGFAQGRHSPGRWHRPVAWVLALVMGIGMVALAFSAVYRGNSSGRQDPVPSPTSGVDGSSTAPVGPSAPADASAPALPMQPRIP